MVDSTDRAIAPPRSRRRARVSGLFRRIRHSRRLKRLIGNAFAGYIRLVRRTSRIVALEGAADYRTLDPARPVIFASWHGQNFLMPVLRRKDHRVVQLVSRHADGDIIAITARRLGIGVVRGSGAREAARSVERGGISGFLKLRSAIESGATASMTADISHASARKAGMGLIALAKATGAPVVPIAIASSRELVLSTWDRAKFALPFGRIAAVAGAFIHVPRDADRAAMERLRQAAEAELNRVTARSYELLDRRRG